MSNDRPHGPIGGYADARELEADIAAAETAWRAPRARQTSLGQLPPGLTYDVGALCPRDALQARLDRARERSR